MEPVRKILAQPLEHGTRRLPLGTYVWVVSAASGGRVLVEHGDERFEVPEDALADVPVPAPSEALLALDPCFSAVNPQMEIIYRDDDRAFSVLRCEHGALFLEDWSTGLGWHSRLIYIGADERTADEYLELWEKHHRMSTDELHLRGIGR